MKKTLWIVEDQRKEADLVATAIVVAFPRLFCIHFNRDLSWPERRQLPALDPDPGPRERSSPLHLPDIVVLDLLVAEESDSARRNYVPSDFPGAVFYERLREEEDNAHKRRCQVILYSQFRGLSFTRGFVQRCFGDNHFNEVAPKSPGLLVRALKERILEKVLHEE